MIVGATERAQLLRLADLLKERDLREEHGAEIIGRRGEWGHVGEFIASRIFEGLQLSSALRSLRSSDVAVQRTTTTGQGA
jgi:hypothetical protein